VWSTANAITLARPSDASLVHAHRPDTGIVVPNGVDSQGLPYIPPSRRKGNTVLFVGDMRAPATVQGARELAERVLPRLRVRVPDAVLTLAGPRPPREVRSLESDNVRVAGGMTSVLPLYRDQAVFALPPASGSESGAAVLEPMACGIPIVASTACVHELPVEEGRDFLGARTAEQLADRLAGALVHRTDLDDMALSSRRIAERHDWEIMGERFAHVVMATVARNRRDLALPSR